LIFDFWFCAKLMFHAKSQRTQRRVWWFVVSYLLFCGDRKLKRGTMGTWGTMEGWWFKRCQVWRETLAGLGEGLDFWGDTRLKRVPSGEINSKFQIPNSKFQIPRGATLDLGAWIFFRCVKVHFPFPFVINTFSKKRILTENDKLI